MRTITTTEKIYNYSDLMLSENSDILDLVLEKHNDINIHDNWHNDDEYFKDMCMEKGFDFEHKYFSGFWSQGDGAMFEGSFLLNEETKIETIELYIKNPRIIKLIKNRFICVSSDFKHQGHYYHEKSYKYNFYIESHLGKHTNLENYPNVFNLLDNLENDVTKMYENLCKEIYKSLATTYDYLQSKEVILETIEANEYEFNENGKII